MACAAPLEEARPLPAPAAPLRGVDGGFRPVVAVGQGLELLLPDAEGWRRDAREAHSWVAIHAATRSTLVARAWRSDAIATPAACEQQMRAWRPDLPLLPAEARLESRTLRLAGDTRAQLWSGASQPYAAPGTLAGYAQLVLSDGRRCVYLAYATRADDAGRARAVAARLAAIVASFERVRRIDIAERGRPGATTLTDGRARGTRFE